MSTNAVLCIPTLNAAKTLDSSIDAVNRLDPEPEETIIVDGGSTDGTREIADSYDISVIDQGSANGLSGARNVALEYCDTEYLAMVDSDVIPASDWLGCLIDCLEEHDTAAATAEIRHNASSLSEKWAAYRMDLSPVEKPGSTPIIPGANGCFRTSALRDVGGWDESYPFANEDLRISERLRNAGYDLRYTEKSHVLHEPPSGLEAVYQLWRWHRPVTTTDSLPQIAKLGMRNVGKSVLYSSQSIRKGKIAFAIIDLMIGPLHTYWDIRKFSGNA